MVLMNHLDLVLLRTLLVVLHRKKTFFFQAVFSHKPFKVSRAVAMQMVLIEFTHKALALAQTSLVKTFLSLVKKLLMLDLLHTQLKLLVTSRLLQPLVTLSTRLKMET